MKVFYDGVIGVIKYGFMKCWFLNVGYLIMGSGKIWVDISICYYWRDKDCWYVDIKYVGVLWLDREIGMIDVLYE